MAGTAQEPRSIIAANEASLRTFLLDYVGHYSIQLQLTEVIAKELRSWPPKFHVINMLEAVTAQLASSPYTNYYDLKELITNAPVLERLVHYARVVAAANPSVLPPGIVPNEEVVEAALTQFHQRLKPTK